MKRLFFGYILSPIVLAYLSAITSAATVTNTADSGSGSLREAIANAAPGDTINFSLTYPATITLSSTLSIDKNLTVNGLGAANLAISGGGAVRVFDIGSCNIVGPAPCSAVTANISNVTIKNGSGLNGGGGILNAGTLNLNNSVLTGNISSSNNGGGAIYNFFGVATITNCLLSGNSSTAAIGGTSGGGILNDFGTLTVSKSTLTGNSALSQFCPAGTGCTFGGGIASNSGFLTVANSTVGTNYATFGGGISSRNTQAMIANTTFFGNSASYGGAIDNIQGSLTATHNTIASNSAQVVGGGIRNAVGASLLLSDSILAASQGGNCSFESPWPWLFSAGHNLSDDATCAFGGSGDLNSTPAGLDPAGLQDNGGPTQTVALLAGPAVDVIPALLNGDCVPGETDQRGAPRPQGFGCDIGAYERKGFSSLTAKVGKQAQGFAINAGFTLSADSNPVDPVAQTVRLQVGPLTVSIPPGSFHQAQGSSTGSWAYSGTINGVKLSVQISLKSDGSYQFNATGSPVDFSGATNPVTVAIGVGFDTGSLQVPANF